MPPDHEERRPREEAPFTTRTTESEPQSTALVTAEGRVMTSREWRGFLEGYQSGYLAGETVGYERGYAACDAEIATLQRTAAEVVHAMAKMPARDPEADKAAAARREARWSR